MNPNKKNKLDHEDQQPYNDTNTQGISNEFLEENNQDGEWENLPCDDDEIED